MSKTGNVGCDAVDSDSRMHTWRRRHKMKIAASRIHEQGIDFNIPSAAITILDIGICHLRQVVDFTVDWGYISK
jgi:hypothetical protein